MKIIYQFILVWLGILVYAQPSGTCVEGTTKLDATGHLYGCVINQWIKISEDFSVSTATYSTTAGSTGLVANNIMLRVGSNNFQLPNRGFVPLLPSAIADAPAYVFGKIFYSNTNKHFYQGVDYGKWHQIDNGYSSTKTSSASGTFTRNNCVSGYVGGSVTVLRTATSSAYSIISQSDADSKAESAASTEARRLVNVEGQAEANAKGTCTAQPTSFTSTQTRSASKTFYRNNCGSGYTGGSWTVSRSASGSATSTVSQADADSKASTNAYNNAMALVNSQGQSEANSYGSCTANVTTYTGSGWSYHTGKFTKNNCPAGQTGTEVTYQTPTYTETRTSTVSQAEADRLAKEAAIAKSLADLNANGQTYANNNGTCTGGGGVVWGTCEITNRRGETVGTSYNVDYQTCLMMWMGFDIDNPGNGRPFNMTWH